MAAVAFESPDTLADALALLAAGGAGTRPLAGGTDLVVQMRSGRQRPQQVVDLKRIPEMIGIREESGGFVIGASTPCLTIGQHAALRAAWPGVVEAACLIGSPQVQGRASLGGNLCNASPAADSAPALIAAGAVCVIASAAGTREIPMQALHSGPGTTVLKPGELLQAIRLPAPQAGARDAYLRMIPRSEMDIAIVGAGAWVALDDNGRVRAARLGLGAVAPTPLLAEEAAAALIGTTLDEAALARMEAAVQSLCRPIDDKRGTAAYRRRVVAVLARRAVLAACQRARG
jgi:carbon-monoxide dehydrogenase medium subunit